MSRITTSLSMLLNQIKLPLLGTYLFLMAQVTYTQTLTGTVKSANDEGIATASVYVDGSTQGALTDADGNYSMDLKPGKYRIVAQMLGFMKQVKTVVISQNQRLDFVLSEEEIEIEETIITSNGKDPAYWIIKQAIKHKEENRLRFESYQYTSYQKTIIDNETVLHREPTKADLFRALKVADSLQYESERGNDSITLPNDIKPTLGSEKAMDTATSMQAQLLQMLPDSSLGQLASLLPMVQRLADQLAGSGSNLQGIMDSVNPLDLGALLNFLGKEDSLLSIAPMVVSRMGSGFLDSLRTQLSSLAPLLPLLSQLQGGLGDSLASGSLQTMLPILGSPTVESTPSPEPLIKEETATESASNKEDPSKLLNDGLIYLEESVTKTTCGKGNKVKEELISGKMLGGDGQYALMGYYAKMIFDFDPYNNMTYFDSIMPKGVVSPISGSALLYYNYKLLGTKKESGYKHYKIQVIPKNKSGPTFSGLIYIVDSSFAVSSLDLWLTKANDIFIFDSIRVVKEYIALPEQGVWVPFGLRARLGLDAGLKDILSIKVAGESQQLKSDWVIDPELPEKFWNNEVLHVGDSAGMRSQQYWADTRKLDLAEEEERKYAISDSIIALHNSPAWQDSMTKKSRHFSFLKYIIGGYHPYNYRHHHGLDLNAPWTHIGFNPVEGWNLQLGITQTWYWGNEGDDHKPKIALDGMARYGVANQKLSYHAGIMANLHRKKGTLLRIEGGDLPQEFSQFQQTFQFQELFYNLFLKRNFYKLYQKQYARLGCETELVNGLRLDASANWEWRFAWNNHTNFSISKPDEEYSPNLLIPSHQAATFTLGLSFKPFNKYWTVGHEKRDKGSKWPLLRAEYQKGIAGILGSDVDFDRMKLSILQNLRLGTVGNLDLLAEVGDFLNETQVFRPDLFHFRSNQTVFHHPNLATFQLMDYYTYSTTHSYLQAHASHAFNGLLMSRLPLIKKLRLNEFAESHFLRTGQGRDWLEAGVGLQKGFLLGLVSLRVDYSFKIWGDGGSNQRVMFTLAGLGNALGRK